MTFARYRSEIYDLQGNRFMVKGFGMIRRNMGDTPVEDGPVSIMFEPLSGTEAKGNILVKELTDVNFLFCNHPLYPRRVDGDYEAEYQAAGLTIYRGWMMKPEMYRDLYSRLEERRIILINTPEEYEKYHMLPGWYEDFANETFETVWTFGNNVDDVLRLAEKLNDGAYIVKDYVKSRKHEWYDACFIKNIRDKNALQKVAGNFIERQGEELVGGVVLRKYEHLKQIGFHEQSGMPLSEEYRVFIYVGKILAIDDYWEKEADTQITGEEYAWIEAIADRVKSNFVTVDLARKDDGTLIIMEFGDGQVSGLQQLRAEEFYRTC